MSLNDLYIVIMAGGEGVRFAPLSTPKRPKQFLNLIGDKTFIRQTYERILPLVSRERIYVSTNERYVGLVREELPEIPVQNIIGEPCKKNTAPALVFAAELIAQRHGRGSIVCCLPSDHYIADEDGFRNVIKNACTVAKEGCLVTLGMKPDRPSTEYGYICPVSVIPAAVSGNLPRSCHCEPRACGGTKDPRHAIRWSKVSQFTEKPKKELAEEYIKKGYLWNGGIFVWSVKTFLEEIKRYAPELYTEELHCSPLTADRYFNNVPSISIDYALMERSDKVAVIPAEIGWSDVGGWESIKKLSGEGVKVADEVLLTAHQHC
jgi:mannose-1-phosphate guanylyltransferase